jgi:hypothetical protein
MKYVSGRKSFELCSFHVVGFILNEITVTYSTLCQDLLARRMSKSHVGQAQIIFLFRVGDGALLALM